MVFSSFLQLRPETMKMKRIILTCLASLVLGSVNAQQTISGIITDQQSKTAIASANVQLLSLTDSSLRSSLTDSSGSFSFSILKKDSFLLSFSYVGYQKFSRKLFIDSADMHLEIAAVPATSSELATVIIRTSISPVSQKGDTLQINASQFKVNPDASGEDLVRKVPGITIENGQVKAQGENVQKVTIDGRDLFGDDATAALRNLPAEIIDKIQVFDRLSDQAQVTGFDDGNTTKAINIVTKANMRNGQFGRIYAGYGTDNRYQAGGNSTILNDNRRISIVGNFNNVNQQNFSQQDLLGLTSNNRGGGGGRRGNRGGGRGGGNQGSFGSSGNFLVGQQNGINSTNAMGINFSDVLSNKITLTGSYLFNNTNNNTSETSNQQYFSGNGFNQEENSSARNNNHRINMRLEWKPDSNNQITIIPNLSFQSNDADKIVSTLSYNGSKQISTTTNTTNNTRQGNNLNNTILYRRSF